MEDTEQAIDVGASLEINSELPPRDPSNDKPKARHRRENTALKEIKKKSYTEAHRKKRRNDAYLLRARAEKVGLPPLKGGRQRDNVRKDWIRELRNREKIQGIK